MNMNPGCLYVMANPNVDFLPIEGDDYEAGETGYNRSKSWNYKPYKLYFCFSNSSPLMIIHSFGLSAMPVFSILTLVH